VHERYSVPSRSFPRHFVHQAITRFSAGCERGIKVGHAVADVVNPWTASVQELADWTVRFDRREQLDLSLSQSQGDDRGAIHHFDALWLEAENVTVEGKRRLEIGYRNTYVSNARAINH
jgi:hypothetical protein